MTDVTVIIPVYNTRDYLADCLDSLVRQSIGHERFEVVAVDDGSTDGSGELLDSYAARFPTLFTVVHQSNSGGPAVPCNVGLAHARGRYVFFLGSDDYLGDEALERMVDKADTWESDVLCARLVGVGGRWVNQRLFATSVEDLPFPDELLASALSNTKLFRRSVIEAHALRFPEQKVASDQPFTISALHHARRVSVLADYDYYYAVRRDEATNLTYSSTWQMRLDGIGSVVRHVADLIPPGEGRDAVLQRHFRGELATLLRRDFAELELAASHEEQVALVARVAEMAEEFLSPGIEPYLRVVDRARYALARRRHVDGLRRLIGFEEQRPDLTVDGESVTVSLRGLDEVLPPHARVANSRDTPGLLHDATTCSSIGFAGGVLHVRGDISARFAGPPRVQVSLVRSRTGGSRGPVAVLASKPSGVLTAPASTRVEGDRCLVEGDLDVQTLLRRGETGPWAVRLRIILGDTAYGQPVLHPGEDDDDGGWTPRDAQEAAAIGLGLRRDDQGRTVVAVSRPST